MITQDHYEYISLEDFQDSRTSRLLNFTLFRDPSHAGSEKKTLLIARLQGDPGRERVSLQLSDLTKAQYITNKDL